MARPELGTKRVCPTTGRKFYDLNQDPIISPYTGEALSRASFEPQPAARGGSRASRAPVEDDEAAVPAGPETVSLDEVGAAEEETAGAAEDETVLGEEGAADDTFLEEEEEGEGEVVGLIDGDIEDDEEG